MKHWYILICLLLAGVEGFGQRNMQKPDRDSITTIVQGKYPGASVKSWEFSGDSAYYVTFVNSTGLRYSAIIDTTGAWMRTFSNADPDKLPEIVLMGIRANFSGYTIVRAWRVYDNLHTECFLVTLKKGRHRYNALFSENTGEVFELRQIR